MTCPPPKQSAACIQSVQSIASITSLETSTIVRAGTYAFSPLYTCPESALGTEIILEVDNKHPATSIDQQSEADNQRLTQTLTAPPHSSFSTHHFPRPSIPSPDRVERKEVYEMHWTELPMGQVELPAGRATLSVRATEIPGGTAQDLKAIRVQRMEDRKEQIE